MPNTIFPCHRICCRRKANTRLVNKESSIKKSNSNNITPDDEKLSNHFSQTNQLFKNQNNIDLDRLTKQYIETINEYRFHLGFSSLELSNELNNRAIHRANQLSIQNCVENTNQFDLIYKNEPLGETVMSCRAPVNNGYDIAKLFHDQLIIDLKNGHSSKKRYTPILNPDCQYLGFGLIHNEEKTKDFIVIYYYPVKKSEDLLQINENSITK